MRLQYFGQDKFSLGQLEIQFQVFVLKFSTFSILINSKFNRTN